jgi:hypothetical protein
VLGNPAVLGLATMLHSKTKPNNRKEEKTNEPRRNRNQKKKKTPKEERKIRETTWRNSNA